LTAIPAAADGVIVNTGSPDGLIAMASGPESPGKIEIEAADDFVLTGATKHKSSRWCFPRTATMILTSSLLPPPPLPPIVREIGMPIIAGRCRMSPPGKNAAMIALEFVWTTA